MDAPVLILGGGTFGLSTAYHLLAAGYKDITVLDKAESLPSKYSAGYDINKIIRAEYPDTFYAEKGLYAINAWKTPFFAPYYCETGYLITNSANAPETTRDTLRRFRASIAPNPAFKDCIVSIESREDIRKVAPQFDGPAPEWTGYFNKLAGYARAHDAMEAVYKHCAANGGVKFALGDGVKRLLYEDGEGSSRICVGAETVSGNVFKAKTTILALGASAAGVLPSIGYRQKAIGVPVAHIQTTPEEAKALKGIPVTYCRDLGFLFEPDPYTGLIKLCPANGGYLYFDHDKTGVSLPPDDINMFTYTPYDDEVRLRQLLSDILPSLADRPFVETRFCWFMDTNDHDYIIDFVPGTKGLVALSGDSGHGYKMLPVMGEWVKTLLEEGEQKIARWKWKGDEERPDLALRAFPVRNIADAALRSKM